MKIGDLVQYVRPDVEEDVGVIVSLRRVNVVRSGIIVGDQEIVEVLWDNGIWADDASEFKVVS